MTHQFIVSVPGRAQPLCIEADSYSLGGFDGDGVSFRKGSDVVAIVPSVDLVARSTCLPEFPELSQFDGPATVLGSVCVGPRVAPARGLKPLPPPPPMRMVFPSSWPHWPLLVALSLGLVVGFGAALSHAGAW